MAFPRSAPDIPACDLEQIDNAREEEVTCARDPIYLFACHLDWRDRANLRAYLHLISALDDPDENIRLLAETLLHRSSPHPKGKVIGNEW